MLYLLQRNKEAYLELSPVLFLYLILERELSYANITHMIPFQGQAYLCVFLQAGGAAQQQELCPRGLAKADPQLS